MIHALIREKRKAMKDASNRGDPLAETTDMFAIAPPTNHTLKPATTPHDISKMAGYGDAGYDSMQGVDRMVTGEVDARQELAVDSPTPGSPVEVGDDASILHGNEDPDPDAEREFDDRRWL